MTEPIRLTEEGGRIGIFLNDYRILYPRDDRRHELSLLWFRQALKRYNRNLRLDITLREFGDSHRTIPYYLLNALTDTEIRCLRKKLEDRLLKR